jgi:predicted RNA-binding Zn-ribbon protein involved in translation (DUF1610 family)
MLIIPKGKLYLAKGLYWGGLLVAIGSLFSDLGFITIIALIIGLVGARLLDKLYICPHCGRKLPLRSEGLTEAIKAQCPEKCPSCKQAITVELK